MKCIYERKECKFSLKINKPKGILVSNILLLLVESVQTIPYLLISWLVGCVLWRINYYAKSSLHMYVLNIYDLHTYW